jgi:hypothetical protein
MNLSLAHRTREVWEIYGPADCNRKVRRKVVTWKISVGGRIILNGSYQSWVGECGIIESGAFLHSSFGLVNTEVNHRIS